jgi:hypothetical protein
MMNLPPLMWLVDGYIPERSFTVMFGEAGVGKTFLALDIACCIATGRDSWCGQRVTSAGPVVYVSAEGSWGLGSRLRSWQTQHGLDDLDGMWFYNDPVDLVDTGRASAFASQIAKHKPELVVIDTLARCLVGGDENSSKDMGLAVRSIDIIREVADCAVLVLHHPTKTQKKTERGSGALKGAADAVFWVGSGSPRQVVAQKMKDAREPKMLGFHLVEVGESMVVVATDAPPEPVRTDENTTDLLRVLADAGNGGLTHGEWRSTCVDGGKSKATFGRILESIRKSGYVEKVGGSGKHQTNGRFVLTDSGREFLGLAVSVQSHSVSRDHGIPSRSHSVSPPLGETDEPNPETKPETDPWNATNKEKT